MPRLVQTLGWVTRPGPWMERLRDRYGDTFTLRIQNEGTWAPLGGAAPRRSGPERIARRSITLVPARDGRVLVGQRGAMTSA
jgi:hypothetical protein